MQPGRAPAPRAHDTVGLPTNARGTRATAPGGAEPLFPVLQPRTLAPSARLSHGGGGVWSRSTHPVCGRPSCPPATRQEAVGATSAAPDSLTYVRQHAAFFHIARAAGVPATRVGAAAHKVDGDIVQWTRPPLPLLGATSPSTMWTAASAIIERPRYVHAKRRTLNQNPKEGREKHPKRSSATRAPPPPLSEARMR